jgi:hypothetical protein
MRLVDVSVEHGMIAVLVFPIFLRSVVSAAFEGDMTYAVPAMISVDLEVVASLVGSEHLEAVAVLSKLFGG